jgi:hypothetical protein
VVFENDQDPECVETNLEAVLETNPEEKLPKLSKHWEELTPPTSSDDEGEDEVDYGAFQVIIL